VSNVKKSIEKAQGADVYPTSKQTLIYQGKVLNDTTTLGENNVTDNSYLFIILSEAGYPLTEAPEATAAPASGLTIGVAGGLTGGLNVGPLDLFPQGIPNVGLSAGAGSLDSLLNDNDKQQGISNLDLSAGAGSLSILGDNSQRDPMFRKIGETESKIDGGHSRTQV
ncbi:hypothetical protein BVRB_016150, partial [Beta vulgaris subsp. vulgaris]